MSLDFLTLPLLAAATLVFLSVLAGVVSARAGFSFLLVFLVAGMLAGEDGPGGLRFDDFRLSFWVGNVALAVILLDGGLRTDFATFRTGLKPSLVLATVGVVLTAVLTALAAMWLLALDWRLALLLGAIVGSTDAAAVFALLRSSGLRLNERVAATLEIESGMNDPMAVYLTLALIGVILVSAAGGASPGALAADALQTLAQQFGLGAAAGLAAGWGLAGLVRRVRMDEEGGGGVRALLVVSAGLAVFAAVTWAGGSGFLAVYLMGLMLGNRARDAVRPMLSAMDGYAWLSQAGMFLLLGLLVTPSALFDTLGPALGVAAVLMFVARPLAVWLCLAPFHFERAERLYIAWVGLRGAVPIVLAVFPLMAGVAGAQTLFNVAFVVVVVSLLLQGATIGWTARRLGLNLPAAGDEPAMRAVFGDFVLDGDARLGDLCEAYGLALPADGDAGQRLADWLEATLQRPPVVGDHALLGSAELSVRELAHGRVRRVGLRLPLPGPR